MTTPLPAATPASAATPAPGGATSDDRRRQTIAVVAVFVLAIFGLTWMWVTLRTTSASFADREVIERNRLGTGTLDIEVGEQTVAFSAGNMAAGDQISGQVELTNRGSLPLRYELSAFAPASPLRDELEILAWRSTGTCTTAPPPSGQVWQVLGASQTPSGVQQGALAPGTTQLVCMSAQLSFTANREAQGRRLDLIIGIDAVHDVEATTGVGS